VTEADRTLPDTPVDIRIRGHLDEPVSRGALRAVLNASHLLGLATGVHLRALRATRDPIVELQARVERAELQARLAWKVADILIARFAKLPERRRPFYSPAARFAVLEVKNALGWSAQKAANVFLVCQNTILNWERQADPLARTVGSSVQPTPPVRRAADVVRHLVQNMATLGFGGADQVARIVARAGVMLSSRSVRRYQRERAVPIRTTPPPSRPTAPPVKARFVHHTWMLDVSEVRQLLGGTLYMAAVFDAFSRVPLAVATLDRKPRGSDMAALLKRAAVAFQAPRYVITDLGPEFVARSFTRTARRLGAQVRYASAHNIHATACLERFWLTLKQTARFNLLYAPIDRAEMEARLARVLSFYVCSRPHEGLGGATPAEAFLELVPAHEFARQPPRGRPGEGPPRLPLQVEHLDPDGTLPVLTPSATA
jgi:transposase InsO family protein